MSGLRTSGTPSTAPESAATQVLPGEEHLAGLAEALERAQEHAGSGALAEAFERYEQILAALRPALDAHAVPLLASALAIDALVGQAAILSQRRELAPAARRLREGLKVVWRMGPIASLEDEAEQLQWVSTICNRLAGLLAEVGDYEGAIEHSRQAVHANEEVAALLPQSQQAWLNLAGNLHNLARTLEIGLRERRIPDDGEQRLLAMRCCERARACWNEAARLGEVDPRIEALRRDTSERLGRLAEG